MIGPRARFLLFLGIALGVSVLCFLAVHCKQPRERIEKSFERDIADGMRVWNPKAGVDSIRFDSCHVEKMKSGPITFGGLDVLCINGLVVNLPFPEDDEECAEFASSSVGGVHGVPKSLLRKAALPFEKVSGLRVNGLVVNRIENRTEVPVFASQELRNHGRSLVLKNCRIFDTGRTNHVCKATLRLSPLPVLAWNGGERRLDDLFPKHKEKMK